MTAREQALAFVEENFENTLEDLISLSKIPSISFPGFDHSTIDQSAERVVELMKDAGLENVQVLKSKNSFPNVYGDHCHKPGKPTLLLYAHHDVQPIGEKDKWQTEPFVPTKKEGPGGMRLYGRGTADDKAGIFVHLAAIKGFLKTAKELPLNIKVLVEGEEEIGSPNLLEFLTEFNDQVQADIMVLTDTANFDCGLPKAF